MGNDPTSVTMKGTPTPPPVRRRWWSGLIAAQESGLVLVIGLMMLGLTLVGGEKAKPVRFDIPSGAEVSRDDLFFVVKDAGRVDMYARDAGWIVRGSESGGGRSEIARRAEVSEVVETRPIPEGAEVDDGIARITITKDGTPTVYETSEGWRVDEDEAGEKRLARIERSTRVGAVEGAPQAGTIRRSEGQVILKRSDVEGTVWYPERVAWRMMEENDGARYLIGSFVVNRFFEKENLILLTTKASYFAVIAVGMTAIIVLAGIDLSVGSIYAVAAVVGAMVLTRLSPGASVWVSVPVGVLVCCGVGAVLGVANGAMIVGLRLHPFIITLGTMAIYRGLVLLFTGGQTVAGLPESIQKGFFKAEVAGVYPTHTVIMIIVALLGTFVLRKTVLGRRVYAIGGNETAAVYAGIPVGRVKIIVYTLGGLLAGLSACMEVGYNATATVGAGQGYELNVIAAAVIGGASLVGGRGSAIGAVLGAILVGLIDNAMVILDINQNYNQVVMGGAIVLAVAVDRFKGHLLKR